MDAKTLLNRFNKLYGMINIYNGIRYLELSNSFNEVYCRTCNESFDRVSYLISEKSSITIILIIVDIIDVSEKIDFIEKKTLEIFIMS